LENSSLKIDACMSFTTNKDFDSSFATVITSMGWTYITKYKGNFECKDLNEYINENDLYLL